MSTLLVHGILGGGAALACQEQSISSRRSKRAMALSSTSLIRSLFATLLPGKIQQAN